MRREAAMQNHRTVLWTLGGVTLGFMLPVIGIACLGMTCLASLIGMTANAASGSIANATRVEGPLSGPAVAVIDVSGVIVSGRGDLLSSGSEALAGEIVGYIKEAAADPEVRAIVLRVDSPGGSVVPADEIYHALAGCGKPVVVSMGDLAASGGYYISMAAKYIIANPNTLTGSIGVISEFPEASSLMEKLGVTVTTIKSGQAKDLGSMYRPMTGEERALWQKVIDETYAGFVKIVADGRNLPEDTVRALADGRVFTGRQALEAGLVDALGYEEEAIAKAAELGGITGAPRVIRYSAPTSLASLLSGALGQQLLPADFLRSLLMPSLEYRWAP
jgi:protease-4